MKRLASIILISFMAISLIGCSSDENVEEILYYIDYHMPQLASLETQLNSNYARIFSDKTLANDNAYEKVIKQTMNLAIQLNKTATQISSTIKNPELAEVHEICVDYTTILLSTYSMISSAFESDDISLLKEANSKFDEALKVAEEYNDALEELFDKYEIEVKE